MKKTLLIVCVTVLLVSVAAVRISSTQAAPARQMHSCSNAVPRGYARCMSILSSDHRLKPHALTTLPEGLTPNDLQWAYNLPSDSAGFGQTVAIVIAYHNPHAEAELAVYRSTFGLPACTRTNGCFKQVDQNGGTTYPTIDSGWAQEGALDLAMVSAICPNCNILLVEAKNNSFFSLGRAVNTAVRLGANVVSNSYGGNESFFDSLLYSLFYNHPGVAITASSGDNGYGVSIPAAFKTVTAVGGTSLSRTDDNARGWQESVWSGAGSGCSAFTGRPSWQPAKGCQRRSVADVSAVADPQTGVAVYSSYADGWVVFGGTSVAAPIIAGVYALADNAKRINGASALYTHASNNFYDVTDGSNGNCTVYHLCHAAPGYDGPTGLGTPRGIEAFTV